MSDPSCNLCGGTGYRNEGHTDDMRVVRCLCNLETDIHHDLYGEPE